MKGEPPLKSNRSARSDDDASRKDSVPAAEGFLGGFDNDNLVILPRDSRRLSRGSNSNRSHYKSKPLNDRDGEERSGSSKQKGARSLRLIER